MKRIALILVFSLLLVNRAAAKEIRIVSLAPSITETLFSLGLTEKEIVGVTNYCEYPKAAKRILRVGSLTTINIEEVVSLRPDYIFTIGAREGPLNMSLKNAGLNVIVINSEGIDGILSSILSIGKIVGRDSEAGVIVSRMKARLQRMMDKSKTIQDKKRIYVEIWDDPITSCGKGSLLDEVIRYAGGINIAGAIDALYPVLNQEFIIAQNPDFILVGYMGRPQADTIRSISNRFGWGGINAIKNKNIICDLDQSLFLKPGPRIVDGIEEIHNRMYGAS